MTTNDPRRGAHRVAVPAALALSHTIDLICLSHLRWDFVFQRPQHLLTRCARERRVFFVEEPVFDGPREPEIVARSANLWIVRAHLAPGTPPGAEQEAQQALLRHLIRTFRVRDYALWFYTPMATAFTRQLEPKLVVYDCMDELANFLDAPRELRLREDELLARADVVFCGGHSLYEAKRTRHPDVHAFPSSIDADHFGMARRPLLDPPDQAPIPKPRLGYFGVIDERLDLALLESIADARPEWQLVLLGPVVKIDESVLPRRANIHYLGGKPYAELPSYVANWNVALLPFAINDATRFISPTKTPEYLAAGRPVVSAPIRDVVRTYGEPGLVAIASGADEFVAAIEQALRGQPAGWQRRVDALLAHSSWDATWAAMARHMADAAARRAAARQRPLRGTFRKPAERAAAE